MKCYGPGGESLGTSEIKAGQSSFTSPAMAGEETRALEIVAVG